MGGLSESEFAAWLAKSCARHGVPVKVTDPGSLRDVVVLLSGQAEAHGASRAVGQARSDPPGDIDSGVIHAGPAGGGGSDDHSIDQRANDRGLSGEVDGGPLSA